MSELVRNPAVVVAVLGTVAAVVRLATTWITIRAQERMAYRVPDAARRGEVGGGDTSWPLPEKEGR